MPLRQPSPCVVWEGSVRAEDLALTRSHPLYGQRLTDRVFSDLSEQGFAIVPEYLPAAQRDQMSAALRKILPPLVRQATYCTRNSAVSLASLCPLPAIQPVCAADQNRCRMNFWTSSVRSLAR